LGEQLLGIVVILEAKIKPELAESTKAFLKENPPDTRNFAGCDGLDVHENLDEIGNLIAYQRWESRPKHEKYLAWGRETGTMDQLESHFLAAPTLRYFEHVDA
jgi:quinol monooxygenase YgiN